MATYTVSNNSDSGPGSLRQAIVDANGAPGVDEIVFAAPMHIAPWTALPQITEGLTINSTRVAGITIDGAGGSRVLWAGAGAIEINNLTILDGRAQGGQGQAGGSGGGGGAGLGGGLFVDAGPR